MSHDDTASNAELNISVTFRHTEPTDSIKAYAREKLIQRISKYYHQAADVNVILSVEKHDQVAEVHLIGKGVDIVAKASTANLYSSIDKLCDTFESQLRKHKEKASSHRVPGAEATIL